MKKTRTYIFDALVNLIVQSVLFFICLLYTSDAADD